MERSNHQPKPAVADEATLLRLLADAARDFAIFAVEPDGTILTWNPGVRNITGYDEDEFIGQNCEMLFTPEDREQGSPEQERETARREGQCLDERWHLKKDNTRFWGSGYMHALRDQGTLIGFAKIVRDMTAQKQYEEQLEARVRERTEKHLEAQRQLLTVQEEERRRISRELHDSTAQHLAALGLELALLEHADAAIRDAAAHAASAASEAATLAEKASHAFAVAAKLAAKADTIPEAARLGQLASEAARTAASTSMDASAAAATADAAMTAISAAAPGAARLRDLTETLSHDLHQLAVDLRPTSLDDLGLVAALNTYTANCAAARAGATVTVDSIGLEEDRQDSQRLPFDVETALYRIVQEALTNVARHAVPRGATRVSVILQRNGDYALATVEDNGPGFDPDTAGAERLGLRGMRERAELLGGTVAIESSPESGTTLYVRIPLPTLPNP